MTTPPSTRQAVTQLLRDWSNGDEGALGKLFPLVHPELHRLAHHYMSRERTGHTLQTTAVLHEAYLRLVDRPRIHWESRAQFFGIAARGMRRILVDYARSRRYAKRGGGMREISLDEAIVSDERNDEVLALDEALELHFARVGQRLAHHGAERVHHDDARLGAQAFPPAERG